MSATEIPLGTGEPGTWRPWAAYTPEPECRPYWTASVRCPNCKARMSLAAHAIDSDGVVMPSIGHPAGVPDCGWHPAPGKLVGWPEVLARPLQPPPQISTCARCAGQSRWLGGWGTDGRYTGGIICDKCKKELEST